VILGFGPILRSRSVPMSATNVKHGGRVRTKAMHTHTPSPDSDRPSRHQPSEGGARQMPATKTKNQAKKSAIDYYVYVPLGAGQLLIEKTRQLSGAAMTLAKGRTKDVRKNYMSLAKRGEKLASSIQRSVYTKRAIEQTDKARHQVKSTVRTIRRAAGATAEASQAAARKVV
jgi:hypothetical protein